LQLLVRQAPSLHRARIGRMDPLVPSFRRELRARAHSLHPVVSIGQHGLTPSVIHEIDVALLAHELVKVRVFSDDRNARTAMLEQVCKALDCAAVQQIGKLFVLWRARPPSEGAAPVQKFPRKRTPAPASSSSTAELRRRSAAHTTGRTGKGGAPAPLAEPARRARTPGKAPSGVPRAAAPRRRRGLG
jgi:putative YhbY family RNA-binding protein